MYQIKHIEFKDLFCFKDVSIDFKQNCNTLILGRNKDDAGSMSNDSGKSAFFDAISWVNTGEFPRRKTKATDVINDEGGVKAFGSIVYEDESGKELEISRMRTKSGSDFFFTGCDSDLTPTKKLEQFLNLFGVNDLYSYFMLTTYFNFSQFRSFADPSMSSSERLKLLEEMFRLDKLRSAGVLTRGYIKEYKDQIKQLDENYSNIDKIIKGLDILSKDELSNLTKQLDSLKEKGNELKTSRAAKEIETGRQEKIISDIKEKQKKYSKLISSITEIDLKCSGNRGKIETIKERISELQIKKETGAKQVDNSISSLATAIEQERATISMKKEDHESKIEELNAWRKTASEKIQKISFELTLLEKTEILHCPHCQASVQLDTKQGVLLEINPLAIEEQKKELLSSLDGTRGLLKTFDTNITEATGKMKKDSEIMSSIQAKEYELSQLKLKKESLLDIDNDIKAQNDQINRLSVEINVETEKKTLIKSEIDSLGYTDTSLVTSLEIEELKLKQLWKDKEQIDAAYNEAYHNYTLIAERIKVSNKNEETIHENIKKQKEIKDTISALNISMDNDLKIADGFDSVRSILLDSSIPSVEMFTNDYLEKLNTDIRVSFEYDPTKTRDEFTLDLLEGGRVSNFDMRGRGKRTRVAICTAYAIRKLYLNAGLKSFGFLFQDEVVDHMDATGIQLVFNMLERNIEGQRFTISHSDDLQSMFSSVLRVEKKNRISNVFWE